MQPSKHTSPAYYTPTALYHYRRRGKYVDLFLKGCRRLAAHGGVIHAIRRMVHELSSRSVFLILVLKTWTGSLEK